MPVRPLETDYLVVGSGAAGMAFTDSLIADSDARVVLVDRRHAPGGHWNDAYSFVRLHQPSAFYGVNSLALGQDTIDDGGPNAGCYERATGAEICGYFSQVLDKRLLPSGRVQYFPMCDYLGDRRFASRVTGDVHEVRVRRKVVDARYLEAAIPATSKPPFEIEGDVACVPVNDLARVAAPAAGYVIIGAGKTAIDACLWLLEQGARPDCITWIKPRESWLTNRNYVQPGTLVHAMLEGGSRYAEAAAKATSVENYFDRVSAHGLLLRVDERVRPTMCKGATVSAFELAELRRIEHVVRLGRVRRVGRHEIVLDGGTVPTSPRHLHVHCTACGTRRAPGVPIFGDDRITLQPVRLNLHCLCAAIVGYIEATRDDVAEKNVLCPPNPHTDSPIDWARTMLLTMQVDYRWSQSGDIAAWLERSRLNPTRGLTERFGEPGVQASMQRYVSNVQPAVANLERLVGEHH